MGEDLDSLRVADCILAVVLDLRELMLSESVGSKGFSNNVGGCDGVLCSCVAAGPRRDDHVAMQADEHAPSRRPCA